MAPSSDFQGKNVFVVGGSKGLGREMSKVMAAQGANVTIFARKQADLDEAKIQLLAARQNENQRINAVSGDMGQVSTVQELFASQPEMPDLVFCVAGGTPVDLGFLIDITPEMLERCMNNNYYSSVYPAQAVLKRWVEDDEATGIPPASPRHRKLIFVNSSASLVPIPGYVAYSAAKAAQRALADTLRLEAMRYSGPISKYTVQCIFAHNYITSTFIEEQKNKPDLCKRIEGTDTIDLSNIGNRFPYAEKIAPEIVEAVKSDDFAVLDKRFEPQFIWANMMGISPLRGWGIIDTLLAILAYFVVPFIRRDMEKQSLGDALKKKAN